MTVIEATTSAAKTMHRIDAIKMIMLCLSTGQTNLAAWYGNEWRAHR